jgi:hypothetical protein
MELENVSKAESLSSSWANQFETVWRYLQSSEVYRRAAGLYALLYHWYSLDRQDLERFIKHRKAIVYGGGGGAVRGLILVDDAVASEWHENSIQTCYIDGDFEAVLDMAKFLLAHCQEKGIGKVYGFTCNHPPITEALERLGFKKPETKAIIFEKSL